MTFAAVVLAFISGGLLAIYVVRHGWLNLAGRGCYLLLWNGASWRLRPARDVAGAVVCDGIEYPYSIATPVEHSDLLIYVVASEPLALADHERFERARVSVLRGALFRPGGDLVNWARVAALIIPVVFSVLTYLRVGDAVASLTSVSADTKAIRATVTDILMRPLRLAPFDDPGGGK